MAEINVTPAGGERFHVLVREGDSSTEHDVTLSSADFERWGPGYASEEEFVRACFAFLLEHEPKDSILPVFDVAAIGGYFPDFDDRIRRA